VEAHRLGSSAYRKTALWTNAAPRSQIQQHYEDHQQEGLKVRQFLEKHNFTNWSPTPYTGDYFPKFMARSGSWMYSFTAEGQPGPGLLVHEGVLQEPCLR
jgi:hypothetical protein